MRSLPLIRAEIVKLQLRVDENERLAVAAREAVREFERRQQVCAEEIAALEAALRILQGAA